MSRFSTVAEILAAIAGLIAVVATALWYVFTLQNQINTAQKEIIELRTRLETIATINSSSKVIRGDKGDKGDKGDQGEKGDRGDDAVSISQAQIENIIDNTINAKLANLEPQLQSQPRTQPIEISKLEGLFDNSKCIDAAELRKLDVILLRPGNEVCDSTGKLLFRVKEISNSSKKIFFSVPGKGNGACYFERKCMFQTLGGREYIYERLSQDDQGQIALFRYTDG